ncbi:MAG TPA: hypothetical protein VGB15_08930, partial [Longimicrobium sp.]
MTFERISIRLRWCLALPLALAAACTDTLPSAPEMPAPATVQRLECTANRVEGTVACSTAGNTGATGARADL